MPSTCFWSQMLIGCSDLWRLSGSRNNHLKIWPFTTNILTFQPMKSLCFCLISSITMVEEHPTCILTNWKLNFHKPRISRITLSKTWNATGFLYFSLFFSTVVYPCVIFLTKIERLCYCVEVYRFVSSERKGTSSIKSLHR